MSNLLALARRLGDFVRSPAEEPIDHEQETTPLIISLNLAADIIDYGTCIFNQYSGYGRGYDLFRQVQSVIDIEAYAFSYKDFVLFFTLMKIGLQWLIDNYGAETLPATLRLDSRDYHRPIDTPNHDHLEDPIIEIWQQAINDPALGIRLCRTDSPHRASRMQPGQTHSDFVFYAPDTDEFVISCQTLAQQCSSLNRPNVGFTSTKLPTAYCVQARDFIILTAIEEGYHRLQTRHLDMPY